MNYFIVISNQEKIKATEDVVKNFGIQKRYIYDDSSFPEYKNANKWIRVAYDIMNHSHDVVLVTDDIGAFDPMFDYLYLVQKEYKHKNKYYNILFTDKDEEEYPKIFKEVYLYE